MIEFQQQEKINLLSTNLFIVSWRGKCMSGQFRANVCHKDIRLNMITCSSNIEGFLKDFEANPSDVCEI